MQGTKWWKMDKMAENRPFWPIFGVILVKTAISLPVLSLGDLGKELRILDTLLGPLGFGH